MPEGNVIDASDVDPIELDWHEIDSRQTSTMVSTWTERLCLRRTDAGFELAICCNAGLGEEPGSYDRDGENTDLEQAEQELPEFYDGEPVAMVEDGIMCGPLRVYPDEDGGVELAALEPGPVAGALRGLEWDASDDEVMRVINTGATVGEMGGSQLSPDLVGAYLQTRYHVDFPERPFDLLIGSFSEPLQALYRSHRRSRAAYVTSCNPLGKHVSDRENERRYADLVAAVSGLGLPFFEGAGRGTDNNWPPEPSVLVLGLSFEGSLQLGQSHDQNAIVWADADAIPRLVLLR